MNHKLIFPQKHLQVMTKKIRHHQLLRYVNQYTSHLWARRIIPSLLMAGQKAREYNRLQKLDTGYLQSFYGRSRRRLLVFDYDGTLVAHHALAQLSAPPPVLLQVLEALCEVIQYLVGECRQFLFFFGVTSGQVRCPVAEE